jgi:hypothetical protein
MAIQRTVLPGWLLLVVCVGADHAESPSGGPAVVPLRRAHAHNDYHHARPLRDALAYGFCSVEADIFLRDGRLLVGHAPKELRADRTLEALYLAPLRARVAAHGGRVYPGGPPLTLLIDIKSAAAPTYAALRGVLSRYRELLTEFGSGGTTTRAVTVIISGNRPWQAILADPQRQVGIDGRLADLDRALPPAQMPLVSDNWRRHFRWRGQGPIPAAERGRLRRWVEQAHAGGYRLRFWATPDNPAVWEELCTAGVDLINTDDLQGLRGFLRAKARCERKPGQLGNGERTQSGRATMPLPSGNGAGGPPPAGCADDR